MKDGYTILELLWYAQRMLVYPAGFFDVAPLSYSPRYYHLPYSDIKLRTKDRVELECYLIKDEEEEKVKRSRGTFVMFHGNAMTRSSLLEYASLAYHCGFNALTVEYRGYQRNKGYPSEKGLQRDAQAALDYVLSDPILSTKPLIVFGQSLGGAVAIDLTSRNSSKVSALIVENTFTSIPDLVWGRFPLLIKWISVFCTQHWHSRRKIKTLPSSLPILMLSGLLDSVVPAAHMSKLWDVSQTRHYSGGFWRWVQHRISPATKSQEKQAPIMDEFCVFEYGEHVEMPLLDGYDESFEEFLDKIFPKSNTVPVTESLS
ncbi:alpha/beta-hydrolase [Pholiota conissans]|uniref:Alpha/beta-hydrolase n=1 Tax=Pholiota conissans TaxID=109636 RepID=A0A9P5YXZ3_9AGAR|nr:alpha/beta-hydrolase [Pholiota conissans]